MSSLKTNFLYSGFLTTANYIFPLLVFPYASRILGAENIGLCNFIDSIINYFILFSTMGIASLGIRETAAKKNDKQALDNVFSSLIYINGGFTIIALILLTGATLIIPQLYEQKEMMFFGGFKLLFNFLLVEWFYIGIEDFKFITIRTLCVRSLYLISVFIFVKKPDDYTVFYLLSVLMIGGNAIINILYTKRFTNFSLKSITPKKYLRPYLILGLYMVLTSMYTTFNVTYLGFATDNLQVGYYSTATKLYGIIIALFTAFTGVVMPRMSSLLTENRHEEFNKLFSKSIEILLSVSIPAVIITTTMASQLVYIIAGEGYEGAILPMRIVMPLIFIIGYEQILIIQTLMPLKKDHTILRNSAIGAAIGVSMNIILVKTYGAVGSSVVWFFSEMTILILAQIAVTKFIYQKFPFHRLLLILAVYLPLFPVMILINHLIDGALLQFSIVAVIATIYFILVQLFILKDSPWNPYLLKCFKHISRSRQEQ